MALGDEVVVIKDSVVQQKSPPGELYDDPENLFVAGFIGAYPMNILEMEIKEQNGEIFLAREGFRLEVSESARRTLSRRGGKRVLFGIRPSAVEISAAGRGAEVLFAEAQGKEDLLHLKLAENLEIKALLKKESARPGERVKVSFDPEKMYFFDPEGARIRPG